MSKRLGAETISTTCGRGVINGFDFEVELFAGADGCFFNKEYFTAFGSDACLFSLVAIVILLGLPLVDDDMMDLAELVFSWAIDPPRLTTPRLAEGSVDGRAGIPVEIFEAAAFLTTFLAVTSFLVTTFFDTVFDGGAFFEVITFLTGCFLSTTFEATFLITVFLVAAFLDKPFEATD